MLYHYLYIMDSLEVLLIDTGHEMLVHHC